MSFLFIGWLLIGCENPERSEIGTEKPTASGMRILSASPNPLASSTVIKLQPTLTPTKTELMPTPSAQPCHETSGTIDQQTFLSETLSEELAATVYLPPCFNAGENILYPLLILLHGQNGDRNQWAQFGMLALADEWINAGKISAIIIVMPEERQKYSDSTSVPYDQALVEDLLPALMARYPILPGREARALGGISRGANWAMQIAFQYPQAFGKVAMHSPTTFQGGAQPTQAWLNMDPAQLPQLWVDIGETDENRKYSQPWIDAFQTAGIPLDFSTSPGRHTDSYWTAHIGDYLTWYTAGW
jgi:enterochelin esterase-like enzyme